MSDMKALGEKACGCSNETTREAWVEQALLRVAPGSRLLDAGAGELKFKKFCQHLKYVSQDFAQYDGAGDNRGLQMGKWDQSQLDIVCDITAIPEPDASFDAILCVEVFEHLPAPLLALQEFGRLLKTGGCLILTAPFGSVTHFAPFHFYGGFTRYFYEEHLPKHGFRIDELQANGDYFEVLGQEIRRLPAVTERYHGRPLGIWARLARKSILSVLARVARAGCSSSEISCFGYHVMATKVKVLPVE
ncbi:methyltransferase domain-containing protein [bacterium]|nr:methyltransferase domain-containing protein [bacterium]